MSNFLIVKRFIILICRGVYGHCEGELPWAACDEPLRPAMSKIVGNNNKSHNV